tara:strand:- start:2293 stop:2742 length:450 start_codon:yes stop_codon:yes gene_type:complete
VWCETVRLELQVSKIEMASMVFFHAMALLGLEVLAAPMLLKLGLAATILASAGSHSRKFLPGFRQRLIEVLISKHSVSLIYQDETLEADLPWVAYMSEYLLILEFDLSDPVSGNYQGKVNLLLLPDSVPSEQARRLRCYLKYRLPKAAT